MLAQLNEASYTNPLKPVSPPLSRQPTHRHPPEVYSAAEARNSIDVGVLVDGLMGVWSGLNAVNCDDQVLLAKVGLLSTYVLGEPLLGNDLHRSIQICRAALDVVDRIRNECSECVVHSPLEVVHVDERQCWMMG